MTSRERAILDYAVKLTENPSAMNERDVEGLREVGLSDDQILEVVEIASWFNYINRVADALDVRLEPDFGEREAPGLDD